MTLCLACSNKQLFWATLHAHKVTLIVAAEFPATSLLASFETLLENVFSRHAFRQRGGWYRGFSDSVSQYVDLINRPFTAAGGRIVKTWIHGEPIDLSKHYVLWP